MFFFNFRFHSVCFLKKHRSFSASRNIWIGIRQYSKHSDPYASYLVPLMGDARVDYLLLLTNINQPRLYCTNFEIADVAFLLLRANYVVLWISPTVLTVLSSDFIDRKLLIVYFLITLFGYIALHWYFSLHSLLPWDRDSARARTLPVGEKLTPSHTSATSANHFPLVSILIFSRSFYPVDGNIINICNIDFFE